MKAFKAIMIAIGIMVVSGCLFAAQIQVTWNANIEPDLAGYRLYVGQASGQYGEPVVLWFDDETISGSLPRCFPWGA